MTEERLRVLYQEAMAGRAARPGECAVSPETMVDVLTGRLPEADRRRILLDIMSDPRCRHEFDLLRAVVAGAPGQGQARTGTPWSAWPLRIAAALVLFVGAGVVVRVWRAGPDAEPVRDLEGRDQVQLAAPEPGTHASAGLRFVWRAVPGAIGYQYNLVTPAGRVVFAATVSDTVLALPDSVKVGADSDLRWWVEAATTEGVQVRSALRRLKIASP